MRKRLMIVLVMFVVLVTSVGHISSANAAGLTYRVRFGDTFWLLSQRFDVSAGQIKAASNYWSNDLPVGQRLTIPVNGSYTNSGNLIYAVRSGDTLWRISQKYGVSIASIVSLNNLNSDYLNVGEVIVLPTSGDSSGSSNDGSSQQRHYTVQRGDTLWLIARRYGTSSTTTG
jgi:LysM repeat protein